MGALRDPGDPAPGTESRPATVPVGAPGRGLAAWAVGMVPVMIILPMYIFPFPIPMGRYAGRRLIEILWAAGLLLTLSRPAVRAAVAARWSALSRTARLAAGVFIGWALLSALVSSAPPYALREWSLITLLLVVALPLGAILGNRRDRVLETVALTLVLYAILIGASPLATGFAHPRFQGQVLAVLVPPLLFAGHWALALMAAPALALGLLNGSRALALAIAVGTAAAWLLWPGRRRTLPPGLAALALAAVIVGIFAALGADASLGAAVERGASSTGRDRMWLDAFRRFLAAPLLGEGPGLLARAPGVAGWAGHPHNSVLLIAAETGAIGLGAVALLVGRGVAVLRGLAVDRRPWALALISGGVHSLFSGTIIMPASQAMLVLALAMVLPAGRTEPADATGDPADPAARPDPAADAAPSRAPLAIAAIGTLALVVLLATLTLPPSPLEARLPGPRFFLHGIIP